MRAILRPYQAHIAAEFERLVARGKRRVIVVAPTGSGKTVIACAIIAATPRRVLVISHRREIVNQTSAKLTACGVPHGIIQAGDEKKLRPMAAAQVASIQTLHSRAIRSTSMPMPLADLVIVDEAHHACAVTYRKILETYRVRANCNAVPGRRTRARRDLRDHDRVSAGRRVDCRRIPRQGARLCAG